MKLRRGEYTYMGCSTEYCSGNKGRCWFCGGVYADCKCQSSFFDTCICTAHAETYKDVKVKHLFHFIKNIFLILWYRDMWWFKYGMWGEE